MQDHVDQGVSIDVAADVGGKEISLLRFNCFDIERSYVYGPENPELATPDRVGGGMGVHCRMDPIIDGNPIGWTIRILGQKLPKMIERAGYGQIAAATDLDAMRCILPDVEACAREMFVAQRNTVKHNRGTEIFEAGNIRFGLEMRRQRNGDEASRSMCSGTWAAPRARNTSRKRSFWPSTASGKRHITTMDRATRTTASIGTGPSLTNRWIGPSSS